MSSTVDVTTSDPGPVGSGRGGIYRRIVLKTLNALAPVVVALIIGAIVLRISGIAPFAVYKLMARNAFGTVEGFTGTLTSATPLLFTGLGTAIAFRAGIFSIGAEGAFVLGGLAAAWLGVAVSGPPLMVILIAMIGAVVAASLFSVPAAWLKVRLGVDEVVSTLMLNFVGVALAGWIVNAFLLAPGSANSQTAPLPVRLSRLAPPSSLNAGFILAIVLVAAYALFLKRSSFGLDLHHVGVNERFAAAQGVRSNTVIFWAMVATGAISGIGGAVHAMGVVGNFVGSGFSASYGFTGIAVALLARRSAWGIIPAALLFGAFANAGTTIQLFANVPLDIVDVLQGTVMMFAVAYLGISLWQRKQRKRESA